MKASINSTRRLRLERSRVHVAIRARPSARPVVDATFHLDDLKLPAEARIVLEAHRQSVVERLSFGTVGQPIPDREPVLQELSEESLQFRIKVVDPANGRLLARGDRITAGGDGDEGRRRELFRVRTMDLGQELWKVELSETDAPTLALNKNLGDPYVFLSDPRTRALVLPMAMRQVLQQLPRLRAEVDQEEGQEDWTQRWLTFAEHFAGSEWSYSDSLEEKLDWIDGACSGFAKAFQLLDRVVAAYGGAS